MPPPSGSGPSSPSGRPPTISQGFGTELSLRCAADEGVYSPMTIRVFGALHANPGSSRVRTGDRRLPAPASADEACSQCADHYGDAYAVRGKPPPRGSSGPDHVAWSVS